MSSFYSMRKATIVEHGTILDYLGTKLKSKFRAIFICRVLMLVVAAVFTYGVVLIYALDHVLLYVCMSVLSVLCMILLLVQHISLSRSCRVYRDVKNYNYSVMSCRSYEVLFPSFDSDVCWLRLRNEANKRCKDVFEVTTEVAKACASNSKTKLLLVKCNDIDYRMVIKL